MLVYVCQGNGIMSVMFVGARGDCACYVLEETEQCLSCLLGQEVIVPIMF